MRVKTLLKIAFKSIMGKKLRSFLTIGGVVMGIGAIVFLVSLGFGLQNLIVERITGLDALRTIDVSTVKSQIIRLNNEAKSRFANFPEVERVEMQVNLPGRLKFGGSSTDVVVFGAPRDYLKLASVRTDFGQVYEDSWEAVIVNTAVLNLVGYTEETYEDAINNTATLELVLLTEILNEGSETKAVTKELKIEGVITDNETPYIYVPASLLEKEGVVNYSQAKVMVKDQNDLTTIRNNIEALGFTTSSAADTVQQINQIFTIFRVVLAGFGGIGLVVASLGMFNTLTVSLLERTREVGLMKALGARRKDIFRLFLFEALLISGIGGIMGIAFGVGLGEFGNFLLNRLAQATGNEGVDIFYTPIFFVAGIFMFSLLVGFLTGLFPSRRAGTISPLDALRYE